MTFSSNFSRAKRYLVPGTERDRHPKTAAFGYFDDGVVRSVRTRGGRRWGDDELAFNCEVMRRCEHDGFDDLEIIINYRSIGVEQVYSTDFDTLREHGRRVPGMSGYELSMPICYWSINGAPPTGPQPEPEPTYSQPLLIEYSEPQRAGGALLI